MAEAAASRADEALAYDSLQKEDNIVVLDASIFHFAILRGHIVSSLLMYFPFLTDISTDC